MELRWRLCILHLILVQIDLAQMRLCKTLLNGIALAFVHFAFVLLCAATYNITIMLDSASLTAGTVSKATAQDRGATLAVHTMIGFCGSAVGAPITGLMLDLSGGQTSLLAWSATLVCMGLGSALVWLILLRNNPS